MSDTQKGTKRHRKSVKDMIKREGSTKDTIKRKMVELTGKERKERGKKNVERNNLNDIIMFPSSQIHDCNQEILNNNRHSIKLKHRHVI